MTDTEIQVAIAEACGWKNIVIHEEASNHFSYKVPHGNRPTDSSDRISKVSLPNYHNDLNALHDAEDVAFPEPSNLADYYHVQLERFPVPIHRTTAIQRAEAFLRTLGKWKE